MLQRERDILERQIQVRNIKRKKDIGRQVYLGKKNQKKERYKTIKIKKDIGKQVYLGKDNQNKERCKEHRKGDREREEKE